MGEGVFKMDELGQKGGVKKVNFWSDVFDEWPLLFFYFVYGSGLYLQISEI